LITKIEGGYNHPDHTKSSKAKKSLFLFIQKWIIDMANKPQKCFRSLGHHKLLDILKRKDKIEKLRYIFNHNFANFELE
jgi:hypothetical protein